MTDTSTNPSRLFIDHLEASPTLMTLATVSPDGYPRTRTVMVNGVGEDGRIFFHTDARSQKITDIEHSPKASLTVLTPDQTRQVTVIGDVVASTAEAERLAFASQSRYLQLLAWLNDREMAQKDADERRRIWAEFDQAHPDLSEGEPPSAWVGFGIVPREYLFWTADDAGPSQRQRFTRNSGPGDDWTVEKLPG